MSVTKYFTEDKYLKRVLKNYLVRDVQIKVANIIADSIENSKNTLIEAPTGSGKTMAYLIPSLESGHKTIISTKTIQLMNQLMERDVPNVLDIIGVKRTVAQLKGRKNYFCPLRYNKFVLKDALMYPDVIEWYNAHMSKYGDFPFLIPFGQFKDARDLMTADTYQCVGSKCSYIENCPFVRQKNIANQADVIVTNHFMLLSDISNKSKTVKEDGKTPKGIFDKTQHMIFDEAHSLPDIFSVYAGVELNLYSVLFMFFENKAVVPMGEVDELYKRYNDIIASVNDNRVLMNSDILHKVKAFIDLSADIVGEIDNDEMTEEYSKYYALFDEFVSNVEGIRYIEKIPVKNNFILNIKLVPYDISHNFKTGLDVSSESTIFVSATLSTKGDFNYFINEMGIDKDIDSHIMPSVFNFKDQGKLYLPFGPDEKIDNARKDQFLLDFLRSMPGSALIICNSNERMDSLYRVISSSKLKKHVYIQTNVNIGTLDFSKGDMVLIGSATLREGIDISEGAFSAVILDKLPFEYFKDLLLEKKAENITENGGNPFMDFFLPRAVLYFKQAIGRLIRHEGDSGLWVVLDERLLNPKLYYRKHFLKILDGVEILRTKKDALDFLTKGGN